MATDNLYNPGTTTQAPVRKRSSTPNVIVSCGVLIALVMVGLCALVLYQGRLDALDRARDTSRNLALLAERDIERNFELYELSLEAVVEGVQRADVSALPPRLRNDVLFDRAATARDLGSLLEIGRASCRERV